MRRLALAAEAETRDGVFSFGSVNLQAPIAVRLRAKEAVHGVGGDVAAGQNQVLHLFYRAAQLERPGLAVAQRLLGIAQSEMLRIQHRGVDVAEYLAEIVVPDDMRLQVRGSRNLDIGAHRRFYGRRDL